MAAQTIATVPPTTTTPAAAQNHGDEKIVELRSSFCPVRVDDPEDPRLAGAIVDIDSETGRATAIRRVMLDETAITRLGGGPPAPAEE